RPRPGPLRTLRRHRRDRGRGVGRRRDRGVVPRPFGARSAAARSAFVARPPGQGGEPGAAQRGAGAGAVPARGAEGSRVARRATVQSWHDPQPLHAVRPRRQTTVEGQDTRCDACGRYSADSDRRPSRRSTAGGHAHGVRTQDGTTHRGEHEPQHRRTPDGGRPAGRVGVLRFRPRGPARHRTVRRPSKRMGAMSDAVDNAVSYTVVVPTTGRDNLFTLLHTLAHGRGPAPTEVLVVDDRPTSHAPEPLPLPELGLPVRRLVSGGRGPAAARNVGWRAATTDWVAFLDDDVLPSQDWPARLVDDLVGLDADVAASV